MRIRTQLLAAAAAAAVVAVSVLLALLTATRLAGEATRAHADSQAVAREVTGLLVLTLEYTLYGGERPTEQWRARHAQLARTVQAAVARETRATPELLALQRSVEPLPALFERLEEIDPADPGALAQRRKQFLVERLMTEMQEVAEARYRWAVAIGVEQAREQRLYAAMVLGAPALLLLLVVVLALVVGRRVLRPLARLQAAADRLRAGQADERIGSAAADELGDMARAFDAMTERLQQHARALAANEARLKLVMDNVPALISYVDAERRYRLVNRSYEQWHGVESGAILGREVAAFYTPEQRARYEPAMDQAYAGATVSYDLSVMRHGTPRVLHVTYIPQRDATGAVQGLYTLAHDVSELRSVEQQLRTMMECSPLGMFLCDPTGACRYVNPAWLRIAGLSLADSLGAGWLRAIHPDDAEALRSRFIDSQTSGAPLVSEHRYRRPDGSIVWVRGHAAPMRMGGHLLGHVGTIEDISERRALDAELAARSQELARSNAELEQFAYVASHDLQEPLRMVTSYTGLLMRRHAERLDGDAREFLGYIDDGARRAQGLIADLLALARIDSQGRPLEPVALQAVLDEVRATLALLLRDSGATLSQDASLPVLAADRRQLGQLLQNLLSNALKFRASAPPRVHVGAAREGDGRWRISVADNGIGIEPKFHARVFGMFQRLHQRGDYPGTGIGLAICKKVVERHGGRIGLESQPGRGATFWFTLADAAPAAAGADRPAPAGAAAAGEALRR